MWTKRNSPLILIFDILIKQWCWLEETWRKHCRRSARCTVLTTVFYPQGVAVDPHLSLVLSSEVKPMKKREEPSLLDAEDMNIRLGRAGHLSGKPPVIYPHLMSSSKGCHHHHSRTPPSGGSFMKFTELLWWLLRAFFHCPHLSRFFSWCSDCLSAGSVSGHWSFFMSEDERQLCPQDCDWLETCEMMFVCLKMVQLSSDCLVEGLCVWPSEVVYSFRRNQYFQ